LNLYSTPIIAPPADQHGGDLAVVATIRSARAPVENQHRRRNGDRAHATSPWRIDRSSRLPFQHDRRIQNGSQFRRIDFMSIETSGPTGGSGCVEQPGEIGAPARPHFHRSGGEQTLILGASDGNQVQHAYCGGTGRERATRQQEHQGPGGYDLGKFSRMAGQSTIATVPAS
jgi:hypothetical protein